MGKKYPLKKYVNVGLIVMGVALFMYSGSGAGKAGTDTGGQVRDRIPFLGAWELSIELTRSKK